MRVVAHARGNIYGQPAVQRFRPGKVNGKHDATPSASLSLLTRTVNEEGFSVPRLSIIIPHRNDQLLEETILSVLENRPRDCEIIVAHDGSYCDPYQLVDEVDHAGGLGDDFYLNPNPAGVVIIKNNLGQDMTYLYKASDPSANTIFYYSRTSVCVQSIGLRWIVVSSDFSIF